MDQAVVVPFDIQGVLEGMFWLFDQIKVGIVIFCKEIDIGEVEIYHLSRLHVYADFPAFPGGSGQFS